MKGGHLAILEDEDVHLAFEKPVDADRRARQRLLERH